MPEKEKKENVEIESFEISVVKDQNLKPFLNVFKAQGKNIAQTELGELFGAIQIQDRSSNSEYIPNLITQVIKKEFFKNPKKGTEESFEHALHKANLALTDLAQHEIIEWMGGFNAVAGAVKGGRLFFVQVGRAKVLLIRDKEVLDITPNQAENSITHPVKTFSSLSSGKIKPGDKVVFVLESAFEFITLEEIKRHCKTFNSDEFDNILSSTLESDGENTGAIVINAKASPNKKETDNTEEEKTEKKETPVNYFGQQTNEKSSTEEKKDPSESKEKTIPKEENFEDTLVEEEEIKETFSQNSEKEKDEDAVKTEQESGKEAPPFEKEPEIYLKEGDFPENLEKELKEKEEKFKKSSLQNLKEKASSNTKKAKSFFVSFLKERDFKKKIKTFKQKDFKSKFLLFGKTIKEKIAAIKNNAAGKIAFFSNKSTGTTKSSKETKKEQPTQKTEKKQNPFARFKTDLFKNFTGKAASFFKKQLTALKKFFFQKFKKNRKKEKQKDILKKKLKKLFSSISELKFFEKFPKTVSSKLNTKRKKVYFIILAFLLIVLTLVLLINILQNIFFSENIKQIKNKNQENNLIVSQDGDKRQLKNLAIVNNFESKILDIEKLNNNLFILTENRKIYSFNEQENSKKTVSLPEETKNPRYLASMQSLQLLLIVSKTSVHSYSPVTGNFFKNNISLPEEFENNKGVGTYLTYLYLPNEKNDQIYRYPRAQGGFGIPEEWFRSRAELEGVADIAVSDSIYIADKNGIISKYFQGEKEFEIRLKDGFAPNKIEAEVDEKSFFVLDIENGEILKLDLNGNVLKSFADDRFKEAQSFQVDFDNKKVYVADKENNLLVFHFE